MSDFNSLVQYTVENISRPVKYIIYKLTEFIRVVDKFIFRQVPAGAASGYANIEKVEGNTVAWNQLVDTGSTSVIVQSGHVYYAIINGTASIATSDGNPISVTGGTDIIHDLTLIFGAGNEPTTVADFEAWMAQNGLPSVADYNAGELLSVKMSGMQTEDSSQQTVDTIALDVTTITGINTATNVRETIFPQGMKQADYAGTVKDEIDLMNGTATVNVGIQDLGTLYWGASSYATSLFYAYITPLKNSNVKKFIMTRYTRSYNINQGMTDDKVYGSIREYPRIYIRDTTFTDGDTTTFKNSLLGVYLFYELATPITYTDLQDANGNPLNPRYKVEQGGTEQVLPANTSTPTTVAPTLTTTYTKDNN